MTIALETMNNQYKVVLFLSDDRVIIYISKVTKEYFTFYYHNVNIKLTLIFMTVSFKLSNWWAELNASNLISVKTRSFSLSCFCKSATSAVPVSIGAGGGGLCCRSKQSASLWHCTFVTFAFRENAFVNELRSYTE